MNELKVWSYFAGGRDGRLFNVRLLLTTEELNALQAAGVVPDRVHQVVGMEEAAATLVAQFEQQALAAGGGLLQ